MPRRQGAFDATGRNEPVAASADLICKHDLDGRLLYVSQSVCDALGMPAAILCRMTIQDLLSKDSTWGFTTYMQRLKRDGFADGIMNIVTREGKRRTWKYRNALEMDEHSDPVIRGVARDVTEGQEAFQAVLRSEEYFRSIIENVSDIIAIMELDGSLRYGSPSVCRVLGYSRRALRGMRGLDLIHPEDVPKAAGYLAVQIADPAAAQTIELQVRHASGAWRSFEIMATNLVKKGRTSAVVLNARDITGRKLLEAQLTQANRLGALGRLAATVAHEFNNVLMGMQPFAELMQRPEAKPDLIAKGAGHIANSIQRGRRIVLDILRFAQPYQPVMAAVDVRELWEMFAPEAENVLGNTTSIVPAIPHGLYAKADRTQISQVLANLVSNARDAMPDGGMLTVDANELAAGASFSFGVVPHPERYVQISIGDTGMGMPRDVMERIFEPLFTTKLSGGTGLGLAVAHQVVTQHEGYIFVESEPGHGSTFHLFLPKTAAPAAKETRDTGGNRTPASRKVLLIDDEQMIVEGITALLEQDGIEVESIGSGFEAAETIARFHPDLVVLDLGLPGMDGSEVYAHIREVDKELPVIFATGHGDPQALHEFLNDPHTRFLQKPFEITDLLEMMVDVESEGTS
ncbi:MAG TPA: PAS domain S-box protein [Thermoanaerobaculia bacterium]|jgi:PAS domain S-box-containing protein|nr:PAS domain S-box protein [Thermoanaerobaculia bacterium]